MHAQGTRSFRGRRAAVWRVTAHDDGTPPARSVAALLHEDALLAEIRGLHATCSAADGYYGPLNCYLFSYFELMERCPAHARPAVSRAFLATARALALLD